MPWAPLPNPDEDPQALSETLDRLVRSMGSAPVGVSRSIFADWDEIVGPQVGSHCRPTRLRDRVLVISVTDPGWATQLRFLEQELLGRIAAATGSDEVVRIEVRVGGPGRPGAG